MTTSTNFIRRTIPDFALICRQCFSNGTSSYGFGTKEATILARTECGVCVGKGIVPIPSTEVGNEPLCSMS